ncbi:MAG: TPM domain-containing protein [Oenococcus sp.]|uniref:TPM domain-containing protein n=1 Tax=Oenococcus sp. TaxID=1979414 RepID=UPI0039E9D9E4
MPIKFKKLRILIAGVLLIFLGWTIIHFFILTWPSTTASWPSTEKLAGYKPPSARVKAFARDYPADYWDKDTHTRYVFDESQYISGFFVDDINFINHYYMARDQHRPGIFVVVVPTTHGANIAQQAEQAFKKHKLDKRPHDTALLIYVAIKDRKVSVVTGSGLRSKIGNNGISWIVNDQDKLMMQKQSYGEGIDKMVRRAAGLINLYMDPSVKAKTKASQHAYAQTYLQKFNQFALIFLTVGVVLVIALFVFLLPRARRNKQMRLALVSLQPVIQSTLGEMTPELKDNLVLLTQALQTVDADLSTRLKIAVNMLRYGHPDSLGLTQVFEDFSRAVKLYAGYGGSKNYQGSEMTWANLALPTFDPVAFAADLAALDVLKKSDSQQ